MLLRGAVDRERQASGARDGLARGSGGCDHADGELALAVGQALGPVGQLDLDHLGGAGGEVVACAAEAQDGLASGELGGLGGAQHHRPGAVAGRCGRAADLDRRRVPAHLDRATGDGHRARRGIDGRRGDGLRRRVSRRMRVAVPGRGAGRPVDVLEAVEDVELGAIGGDRVGPVAATGHVSGVVADVDLVVTVVAGDDVDAAAGVDGVVARPAEQRVGGVAAGQGVVARAARGGHRVVRRRRRR